MSNRIGQQFGQYRLLRLLGQGGFAEVYLGEHVYLGTEAAIKILYTQVVPEDIAVFQQEARLLASLKHSHIVRVLDFGVDNRTPYLVMEYAPGGTLRSRHPKGTRLPLSTVVDYVTPVAQALQYAHEHRVIHRDIKPENMLIGEKGEILLSDFGIALIAQSSRYPRPKDMAGTLVYMAPEQIAAHPRRESDQYSLAIVVYEWLSGSPPFHGSFTEIAIKHSITPPPPLRGILPALSPEVDLTILRALAKKPEERFATIGAFATALEQASDESPTEQARPLNSVLPPHPNLSVSEQSLSGPVSEEVSGADSMKMASRDASWYHASHPRSALHSPHQSQDDVTNIPFFPSPALDKASIKENGNLDKEDHPPRPQPTSWSSLKHSVISHPRYVMLICLALLVIIGSSAALFAPPMINHFADGQATVVANEKGAMTATAQAAPTVTAAAATASIIAANPNPYPPGGGRLILNGLLKNNNDLIWQEDSNCSFKNDGYHVNQQLTGWFTLCATRAASFSNFAFEVVMKIITGDGGGITFRADTTYSKYSAYTLFIRQDGHYFLNLYQEGRYVKTLTSNLSSTINQGLNQTNLIAVVAKGNTITVYVNHQQIADINDDAYSQGQNGFIADAASNSADVVYTSAKIWAL
jgi:serine/threonine protein kinase